jgi:hypothetical protein
METKNINLKEVLKDALINEWLEDEIIRKATEKFEKLMLENPDKQDEYFDDMCKQLQEMLDSAQEDLKILEKTKK